MNKIMKDISLPRIVADRDAKGVIPIVFAEKTIIASEIPKFAGVS